MDNLFAIHTEEIQTDGTDTFHFHRYEPTPYDVLQELFHFYSPSSDDVAVDFGCGLGRFNFYLAHFFRIPSVGIEMNPHYYERALKNLSTFQGDSSLISFVCAKAEDYEIQKNETLFYFFNPFSVDIFRRVINNVLLSFQNHPRTISLVLYYPEDDVIYYLEHHTSFHLKDEIAASDEIINNRRERFSIYELTADSFF